MGADRKHKLREPVIECWSWLFDGHGHSTATKREKNFNNEKKNTAKALFQRSWRREAYTRLQQRNNDRNI